MISPELRAQIRRYYYAEHWQIGTIARELNVHPDTVRNAIETQRLGGGQPVRPSMIDPYLGFIRETLDQHPRLRATRIYHMIRERGYSGSVVQLRRAVTAFAPADPRTVSAAGCLRRRAGPGRLGTLRPCHGRSRTRRVCFRRRRSANATSREWRRTQ